MPAQRKKIICISGLAFFGQPSPMEAHLEPLLEALAREVGAEFETFAWDADTGLLPYVTQEYVAIVTHSFGGCRFAIDARRMDGNFDSVDMVWCPIDPVLFTTDDNVTRFESSWGAQLQNKKIVVPENVRAVQGYYRKLPFPRVFPLALTELPVNALLEPRDGVSDTEIEGVDHNSIVDKVADRVVAFVRDQLA